MQIPVKQIQQFYSLLKAKNIPEEYIWNQLKKKFNLPRIALIWAIEKKE